MHTHLQSLYAYANVQICSLPDTYAYAHLHRYAYPYIYRVERWNCRPRKNDMIPFLFNENQFSFFVADHLLVGQLCTNPKSNRSLLSCLKVTQCSTSEIRDAPLYNSCYLPIQVMTTGPLPAPSKLPRITGTCLGWWKQSFRLQLWSLVWFQVRATSCHLTSLKSAWKSTPKCTWKCWSVWWSPGAIRWPVADSGCGSRTRRWPTSPKRPRLGFRRSATTLYPSLTRPLLPRPGPTGLLRLVIRREHHQHDLAQHQSRPDRRHPLSIHRAPVDTCGKGMLPVPDPYRGGDWGWR